MKITISITPDEEEQAAKITGYIRGLLPHVRVKKSTSNSPFTHIFLTTKSPASPSKSNKNA